MGNLALSISEHEAVSIIESLTDWTVADIDGHPGSANDVFFFTTSASSKPREFVLKCCSGSDPEAVRIEPYLLDALDRETSVPVPNVVKIVDHDERIGGPLFIMEQCDGEDVSNTARSLSPAARERIAYEAGRNLGEIHALGSFDRFGDIRLSRDVTPDRSGYVCSEYTLTVGDEASNSWDDRFLGLTNYFLQNLDEQFTSLEAPMRTFIEERVRLLGDEQPVLTDNDYWYFNLLVEPDTGMTQAVLDFEHAWTAHAEYNIASTIDGLSVQAPLESDRRVRVRNSLYKGYTENNSLDIDDVFRAKRDLYRVAVRLLVMSHFDTHTAGYATDRREKLANQCREFVENIVYDG